MGRGHIVAALKGPGVQHGQTQISVDDVRCHQWLTNRTAGAPLHWRHEPTSIHQVSVADTSCGKPPVYSCRQPRGSMFLYLRAEQTLSVHGTVQVYCDADTDRTAILYLTLPYLTLPYGEDVLPPSAEASNGPNAHPRINRKVTKSPSAILWVYTNTWNHPPPK